MIHFLVAGFLIGFATCIRVTSIFIVLAAGVWILLNKYWKKLLTFGDSTGMWSADFSVGMGWSISLPCRHGYLWFGDYDWAFSDDGKPWQWNVQCKRYEVYTQFSDTWRKSGNNKKVYLEHLRENGVLGNLKLAIKKEAIVWGIGTHGYTQYTKNVVEKQHAMTGSLVKNPVCSRTYMQAYNIVLICSDPIWRVLHIS